VDPENCAVIRDLGDGCFYVKIDRGFKDSYDIADIAQTLERYFDFQIVVAETSFFLSRESAVTGRGGMTAWRSRLFAWMMRSAQPASDFFRIPPNRAIEIGTQIVI
jgi:KUP system potassium uptake protein